MKRITLAVLALLCVFAATPANAQQTTGNITGRITDAQGAAVPGVTVTAKNASTGFVRTEVADQEGVYRILALPVGTYELTAELSGFNKFEGKGVVVLGVDLPVAAHRPGGDDESQDVEAPAAGLGHRPVERTVLGGVGSESEDVGTEPVGQVLGRGVETALVPGDEHEPGPLGGQDLGGGEPHPPRPSDDHHRSTGQPEVHCSTPAFVR